MIRVKSIWISYKEKNTVHITTNFFQVLYLDIKKSHEIVMKYCWIIKIKCFQNKNKLYFSFLYYVYFHFICSLIPPPIFFKSLLGPGKICLYHFYCWGEIFFRRLRRARLQGSSHGDSINEEARYTHTACHVYTHSPRPLIGQRSVYLGSYWSTQLQCLMNPPLRFW